MTLIYSSMNVAIYIKLIQACSVYSEIFNYSGPHNNNESVMLHVPYDITGDGATCDIVLFAIWHGWHQ